jgi:hypothetical protein
VLSRPPPPRRARRAQLRALAALAAALYVSHVAAVTVTPDLPPGQRNWSDTGNSDFVVDLPFDYREKGPSGIILTTIKSAPGCSPDR